MIDDDDDLMQSALDDEAYTDFESDSAGEQPEEENHELTDWNEFTHDVPQPLDADKHNLKLPTSVYGPKPVTYFDFWLPAGDPTVVGGAVGDPEPPFALRCWYETAVLRCIWPQLPPELTALGAESELYAAARVTYSFVKGDFEGFVRNVEGALGADHPWRKLLDERSLGSDDDRLISIEPNTVRNVNQRLDAMALPRTSSLDLRPAYPAFVPDMKRRR